MHFWEIMIYVFVHFLNHTLQSYLIVQRPSKHSALAAVQVIILLLLLCACLCVSMLLEHTNVDLLGTELM